MPPKPRVQPPSEPPPTPDEPPEELAELEAPGEAIDARSRLLAWAESQIGPKDPDRYYAVAAPQFVGTKANAISWCGVFCLAGLLECGIAPPEWRWVTSLGFVNREEADGSRALPMGHLPKAPGDIVVFKGPNAHHAIVKRWADGYLWTIDGNTLSAPAEGVAERKRRIYDAYGFYSLSRLLGEAPAP